ncbi:hypothetical protein [Actinopolyspora mortivallis]|uniref:hypothetical protein n=1 Tax=Actinopolyspora mortivallis TaxID=33906 RepID=UPI0003A84628|nr:hypothetical protein [Actinopolyspora mortivallis]
MVLWATSVAREAISRKRNSTEHELAIRLLPLDPDTSQRITEQLRQGKHDRAFSELRRATALSLSWARAMLKNMANGVVPPANYAESWGLLRTLRPELVAETERIHNQRGHYAAVRHLRRHLPVGLGNCILLVREGISPASDREK